MNPNQNLLEHNIKMSKDSFIKTLNEANTFAQVKFEEFIKSFNKENISALSIDQLTDLIRQINYIKGVIMSQNNDNNYQSIKIYNRDNSNLLINYSEMCDHCIELILTEINNQSNKKNLTINLDGIYKHKID
jgi:hypothetical protein